MQTQIKNIILIAVCTGLSGCNSLLSKQDSVQSIAQPSTIPVVYKPEPAHTVRYSPPALEQNSDEVADDIQALVHEPEDVWDRIRMGMRLPNEDYNQIEAELHWYTRHQDYMDRVSDRARPYLHWIVEEVERRQLPMELALLPVVESAFQPFAYSSGRASGIWQFIPGTGRNYGLKQNWWYDGRRDIAASTNAALNYLENLNARFDGDWLLAIAAYNCGEGNVEKAIRRNKKAGKPTDFWSLDLPRETRAYVPRLLAVSRLVKDPAQFQINLNTIPNEPYLAQVDAESQIDIARVADLAGISIEEFYLLNPGFSRWATAPKGPHSLLLPLDKVEQFESGLAQLPVDQRISYQVHTIRQGESLSVIANRYRTSISALKTANKMRNNNLRAGKKLLIPTSAAPLEKYALSVSGRSHKVVSTGNGTKQTLSIRSGDNLWDLSRTYNVSVAQLRAWNGLKKRALLHPGQKLVVWLENDNGQPAEGAAEEAVAARTSLAMNTPLVSNPLLPRQTVNYRVKNGDSLWVISRRFQVSVAELRKWNGLPHGKILQPGDKIKVYVDVAGDMGLSI